jgi:uncharacterized membrane protein
VNTVSKHAHLPSISELLARRKPVRNVNAEYIEGQSKFDRAGDVLSNALGSTWFFVLILALSALWALWNLVFPDRLRFDEPWGYDVYQYVATVVQLALMPLILLCQNLQERHARLRAENDYQVNKHAAEVIDVLLQHTEYQSKQINELASQLQAIAGKLDSDRPSSLQEI